MEEPLSSLLPSTPTPSKDTTATVTRLELKRPLKTQPSVLEQKNQNHAEEEGSCTPTSGQEGTETVEERELQTVEASKRRRIEENITGQQDVTQVETTVDIERCEEPSVVSINVDDVVLEDHVLTGSRSGEERTEAFKRGEASLSTLEVSNQFPATTETNTRTFDHAPPQTGSTEKVDGSVLVDGANVPQRCTKEAGIEAEGSATLLATDTAVQLSQYASDRETTPETETFDRISPQRESTGQVCTISDGSAVVDDANIPQSLTNKDGIQMEESNILSTTDTGERVPEDAPDREATTTNDSNLIEIVTPPNETAATREQGEQRGNVEIDVDLDEDTHVQQAQASVANERQRRREERRSRNRVQEVIDLTDEYASGRNNIVEMFRDEHGSSVFVRRRVLPTGTQNEVVTIASDDEQEVSPMNLAGRDTLTTRLPPLIPVRSHPLHIPIGLDYTIGAETFAASENENDDEKDDDGSLSPNDQLSDGESTYDDPRDNEDMFDETDHDTDGFDPYTDEGGIYNNSDDDEGIEENDGRPSSSICSGPPVVVGVSSTRNVASTSNPSTLPDIADASSAEIIVLDDDDGNGPSTNTRPSNYRTPPPRPRPSSTSQVDQSPQLKCSVCLDIPQLLSYTDCGHVYCEECIRSAVKVNHKCPVCRKKMTLSNIRIMQPLLQFDA